MFFKNFKWFNCKNITVQNTTKTLQYSTQHKFTSYVVLVLKKYSMQNHIMTLHDTTPNHFTAHYKTIQLATKQIAKKYDKMYDKTF